MIKGCQRKMIVLRQPSGSFETAYLILRSDPPPCLGEGQLLGEAERLIASVSEPIEPQSKGARAVSSNRRTARRSALIAYLSGLSTAAFIALLIGFFAR